MKKTLPIILIIIICLLSLLLVSCSGDKYTVNFETNGGSELSPITLDKEKSSFTLPETPPTKEGHIFVGWYFDNDTFSLPATAEEILTNFSSKIKSITIYAKWTAAEIPEGTYLINFETNGGSSVAQITIEQSATTFAMPTPPTKQNYNFEGWFFDNGTFTQSADIASILSSLSASTPYVTVFAKWGNPYPVAFDTLAASLSVCYSGINAPPAKPSDEDNARLEQLLIELEFSQDKTLSEHYNYVDGVLISWDNDIFQTYQTYQRYSLLASSEVLSPEEQQELENIVQNDTNLSSYSDENERNNYVVSYLNIYSQYDGFTQAKLDLFNEYRDKAKVAIKYNEYTEKLTSFEEYIDSFIKSIAVNDIRLEKIKSLSSFLAFYDYSKLLSQYVDKDNQTYLALNPDYFVDFLLELRQTCELTKEDVGLLSYKLIIAYLQAGLTDINEQIIDLNNEIAKYNDDNNLNIIEYLEQLNKTLLFAQENKVSLEKLSSELNLSYITEAIDLILGVTEIINNNNLLDIMSGNSEENAPTLGEVATIISSLKTACDQLIATYTTQDFTNSLNSLSVILTALENENSYIGEFAAFLKSILPNDPIASVSKISEVLNLLTEPTLDVFFNRELDEETTTYRLNIESNNFFENLAILEAKIISILSDGVYNQDTFSAAYDTFLNSVSAFLPHGLSFFNNTLGKGQLSDTENSLSKYLTDLLFDKLKTKIVINEERFATILSVANNDFITSQNPQIPQNLDSLVLTSEYQNYTDYLEYTLAIKDSYNSLYSGNKGNLLLNTQTLTLLLYAIDIDQTKLSAYNQYISNLANLYSDKSIEDAEIFYAYAFDGLFKENCFTVEEVNQFFELLLYKGVEYFKDNLELFGINGAELNSLIDNLLSDTDTDKADLAFALVNSLRLSSELAICFNKDFTQIAPLSLAFNDAKVILERYAVEDIDEWNLTITTIKEILNVLKNTEGVAEFATFIDYFVTAPNVSLTKLSQILGLFDIAALNVFLNEEIDPITNEPYLMFDSENEYFNDNLTILEAKILDILIENNLDGIFNTFNHTTSFIKAYFLETLSGSLTENDLDTLATLEKLLDHLIQKISTELIIDIERYTAIVNLSEKPFILDGDHLTAADYETVIICNILNKYSQYEQAVKDIIYIYSDYDYYIPTEIPIILSICLYMNDISINELNSFINYRNSVTESNLTEDILTFFVLVVDGLFEAGFTNDEILILSSYLSSYVVSYANETGNLEDGSEEAALEFLLYNNYIFINILKLFADNLLYFDIDDNFYKLNFENILLIHTEIDNELDTLLYIYENTEGMQDMFNRMLSTLFDYVIANVLVTLPENELSQKTNELNTYREMIFNLIEIDLDAASMIGKIKAILDEYDEASKWDLTATAQGIYYRLVFFKAKVIFYILCGGEVFPYEKYPSVIAAASTDENVAEMVNKFFEVVYDPVRYFAISYNYIEVIEENDSLFFIMLEPIITFENTYFPLINYFD